MGKDKDKSKPSPKTLGAGIWRVTTPKSAAVQLRKVRYEDLPDDDA